MFPMASIYHIYLLIVVVLAVLHSNRATKERTLAMIKPDGLEGSYGDKIKKIVLDYGFNIVREMTIQLDEDSVQSFYTDHSTNSFFPSLIKYMTSGPVLIMVLEKDNAVADWRKLIGPTDAERAKITHPHSIRAMCGISRERNCVHGSDSIQSASREISFFFGFCLKKRKAKKMNNPFNKKSTLPVSDTCWYNMIGILYFVVDNLTPSSYSQPSLCADVARDSIFLGPLT